MKGKPDPYDSYTSPASTPSFTRDNKDECSLIDFIDKLKKIQAGFASVSVGDELDIRVENINVLVVYNGNTPCGNIVSSFNGKIIQCKRNGRTFRVKVLSKSGDIRVYCL